MRILKGDIKSQLNEVMERSQVNTSKQEKVVADILADVKLRGDEAVFDYTQRFDNVRLSANTIEVSQQEIDDAYDKLDDRLRTVIERAAENIRAFHALHKREDIKMPLKSGYLATRMIPVETAGVYVPGGRAPLPSSVLMNIIPAQIAGVKDIIMCTPPQEDGSVGYMTLAAAKIAGATKIYKVGGAQAIAAMAYGTQSIPQANVIVGPGNIYVALAKKQVFGQVGIESIAGPSEVLVIADDTAEPKYVAADLLSQAEHDPLAAAVLVTTSEELANKVSACVDEQIQKLTGTKQNAIESLENHGAIFIVDSIEEGIELANSIAPEHLEIIVKDQEKYIGMITNAGAVFVGQYSPEPLGDYYCGTNHILPTSQTAKFSSPLGVEDFTKRSSVIYYSKEMLEEVYEDVRDFAQLEGLEAHARSASIRFEK